MHNIHFCRFWYQNPAVFTPNQLAELEKVTLARIICDNGDNIQMVPTDAFQIVNGGNLVTCNNIPSINLGLWSEWWLWVHAILYRRVIPHVESLSSFCGVVLYRCTREVKGVPTLSKIDFISYKIILGWFIRLCDNKLSDRLLHHVVLTQLMLPCDCHFQRTSWRGILASENAIFVIEISS